LLELFVATNRFKASTFASFSARSSLASSAREKALDCSREDPKAIEMAKKLKNVLIALSEKKAKRRRSDGKTNTTESMKER
jgi:hypothetical protein